MKSEFINTNNLGGYTSSTFLYGNTRKYHGVLVVSDSNLNRDVIVNSLEEKIIINNVPTYLSKIQFNSNLTSNSHLKYYSCEPFPLSEYEVGDKVSIHKLQRSLKNKNSVEIIYEIDSKINFLFELKPLLTNRNFHSVRNLLSNENAKTYSDKNQIVIFYPQNSKLHIKTTGFQFFEKKEIYHDVHYKHEYDRGYEYKEDLTSLGYLQYKIREGKNIVRVVFEFDNLESRELLNLNVTYRESSSNFEQFLRSRIDDFLINKNNSYGLIAGYHWFGEWGRDTLISFRGALLTQNKTEIAKKILLEWSSQIKYGLVPNQISPDVSYNSIDASMWFVVACYHYYIQTKDYTTLKKLYPQIFYIVDYYTKGTNFGIYENKLGFIQSNPEYNLSWMDSMTNGISTTQRLDCLVEIQVLWFNTLIILSLFEQFFGELDNSLKLREKAHKLKINFNKFFLTENYAFDSINSATQRSEIRPNIILGLSLPFAIVNNEIANNILKTAENKLLTIAGLRTLSYEDPNYIGNYDLKIDSFDKAYHNGSVWPWLLGIYLKAKLQTSNYSQNSIIYAQRIIREFTSFIKSKDLQYIPEVFMGNTLEPDGTLTQLWNYATLYEVIHDINFHQKK